MAKKKPSSDMSWLLGRVSSKPMAAVQKELNRLKDEEKSLVYVADDLKYGDFKSYESMLDRNNFDSDIDDVLALEASQQLLNPLRSAASLEEALRIIDLIRRITEMREEAHQRFSARLENEMQASADLYNYPDIDGADDVLLSDARRPSESEREVDRERLRTARPATVEEASTSILLRLLESPPPDDAGASKIQQPTLADISRTFVDDFHRNVNRDLDRFHGVLVPSFDPHMDAVWTLLDREDRDTIIREVHRSIIIWRIAEPALHDKSQPGVLPSLLWGLQLPITADGTTLSKSGLAKARVNLSGAWSRILTEDPRALLWAARVLAPPGSGETALDALCGFATHTQWEGKKGRKSLVPSTVSSWTCAVCGTTYAPGDPTHNSPHAGTVKKTIDNLNSKDFDKHGRVVCGLPDRALRWQRLMCNNHVDGHPCWHRGGVLVPSVKDDDRSTR